MGQMRMVVVVKVVKHWPIQENQDFPGVCR